MIDDIHVNDVDMLDDIEHKDDFGITKKAPPEKKYVRTMMKLDDGNYVTARINLSTGEIKPYKYKSSTPEQIMPRPKADVKPILDYTAPGDLLDYTPHWVDIPPPNRCLATAKGVDKLPVMRKSRKNPNKVYLEAFENMTDAIECLPWLDDLIVGVANLDCGNSRPLKTGLLFGMLRDCEEINVETIFAYTGHSEKHCWRLAQYMRILVTAFDREVER